MTHAELLKILAQRRHAEFERAAALRRLVRQRRAALSAAKPPD